MESARGGLTSGIRDAISGRLVATVAVGILAGYSATTLVTAETVALPLIGAVSARVLGVLGLAVAVVAYQRVGCDTCGEEADCGCSGTCETQRSHDQ